MARLRPPDNTVTLRVIVLRPLRGVVLAAQARDGTLRPPSGRGLRSLWFDLDVQPVARATGNDLRGPFVHGPPGGRFLYISAGQSAGQAGSCWARRAKVSCAAIPGTLLAAALEQPTRLLAAAIESTARDGGPACATVPLASAWRLVRRTPRGVAKRRPRLPC